MSQSTLSKLARQVAPRALPPRFDNIPAELTSLDRWLLWSWERRDARWTKVPRQASGRNARTNDQTTWTTFDRVRDAYDGSTWPGVGFVVTPGDGLVGIDLDKCRDPETGKIEPWAREIIDEIGSYTEISASGTGIRIFARGSLPFHGRRKDQVELYDGTKARKVDDPVEPGGRFFTVTGHHIDGTPTIVEHRQDQILALHARIFGFPLPKTSPRPPAPEPLNLDDAAVVEAARTGRFGDKFWRLWRGDLSDVGDDDSRADYHLTRALLFWSGGDEAQAARLWRQSSLYRAKLDRADYVDRTIRAARESMSRFYLPGRRADDFDDGSTNDAPPVQHLAVPRSETAGCLDLVAQVDQLRARLAEVESERDQLRAEVARLRAERSAIFAVQRNKAIKAERSTALATVFACAEGQARGKADAAGWVPVVLSRENQPGATKDGIADNAGVGRDAASRHLDQLERWGVVDKRVERECVEILDQSTGELRVQPLSRLYVRLKADVPATLDRLATLDPRRDAPDASRRTWGGARATPTCPDHPDDGVTTKAHFHCRVCDRDLGVATPVPQDAVPGDGDEIPTPRGANKREDLLIVPHLAALSRAGSTSIQDEYAELYARAGREPGTFLPRDDGSRPPSLPREPILTQPAASRDAAAISVRARVRVRDVDQYRTAQPTTVERIFDHPDGSKWAQLASGGIVPLKRLALVDDPIDGADDLVVEDVR